MPNRYQIAKAKRIVRHLQACADATMEATSPFVLARCVAMMSMREWQTVAFAAGVPLADLDCKAAVLAMLRGRTLHRVAA